MTISLEKGSNLSLDKVAPGMTACKLKLTWKKRETDGEDFDIDSSLFMLTDEGKVKGNEGFIFYGQTESACGAVKHEGDDLTGAEGEVINLDLSKVPADITKIVGTITIHKAEERRQNFGQIEGAGATLVNTDKDTEVATFDLSEDYSTETSMVMCEIYKKGGEWKFKAVGQGFEGGLKALCDKYGVTLG